MRTSVAVVAAASMAVVGFLSLSRAADSSRETALNSSNQSAAAYNATTQLLDGIGQALAPGLIWMGIAAIVLVSLGVLVATVGGGR